MWAFVQCIAGYESNDNVLFYPAPDLNFGIGSVAPQSGVAPVTVVQSSLDEVLDRLGIPEVAVVKLDVEGAELGALQGLRRRLGSASAPAVIFEFADWAEARLPNQAAGDAQAFLLRLGYRLFLLGHNGTLGAPLGQPITSGFKMLVALPPQKRVDG
jgi:hypothetical protein